MAGHAVGGAKIHSDEHFVSCSHSRAAGFSSVRRNTHCALSAGQILSERRHRSMFLEPAACAMMRAQFVSYTEYPDQ